MLTLNNLTEILKNNLDIYKDKYNVQKLGIFGSYARGEQTENSDIDILVFYNGTPDHRHFRFNFELNEQVDLATLNSLRENTKRNALKDVIYIE